MKPAWFDYYAPRSLEEALRILAEAGADGRVLAGGQSLMPMLAFRVVPAMFSGPVAAVLSDRVDRRRLIISCDIFRGLIILAAPFMTRVWAIYVLLFFLEGASIIWLAARDASIPNLVGEDELTMANSLSMATTYGVIPFAALLFSLTTMPAVTRQFAEGSFLAANPTAIAFALDSLTFFISAAFFFSMHLSSPKDHLELEETWGLWESLTFAMKSPLTRSLPSWRQIMQCGRDCVKSHAMASRSTLNAADCST